MDTKEMQNNKHDNENTYSVQMQVLGVKLAATCGYLRKRGWDVCWGVRGGGLIGTTVGGGGVWSPYMDFHCKSLFLPEANPLLPIHDKFMADP